MQELGCCVFANIQLFPQLPVSRVTMQVLLMHRVRVASSAFRYTCTFTIVVLLLLARAPIHVSPCLRHELPYTD